MLKLDKFTIKEQKECRDNLLESIFFNGKLIKDYSLKEIRTRLHGIF